MSELQVKIDGEWKDFCDSVDKPMTYFEQEEICKTKILTDIRDYLVEKKKICDFTWDLEREMLIETLLSDLTEYAEKLGVEL